MIVASFISQQLGLQIRGQDEFARKIRFGTWRYGNLRRAVSLEFRDTAEIVVGLSRIPLNELIIWSEDVLIFDKEALAVCADGSMELQRGNKRNQPSDIVRAHKKRLTEIRDQRLQKAVDSFNVRHPRWSKQRIAKEIARSGSFQNVSWQRIARVTRIRKK